MLAVGPLPGATKIVGQRGPIIGMRTVVDDHPRALPGREAAQVGQTLLCHDDLNVLRDVVDMAGLRNNRRYFAGLGRGRGHEYGDISVAGEIARAADPVLDAGPHDVRGIDVAVDVGLDHGVHGDATQASD